jgi:hypothetical protein
MQYKIKYIMSKVLTILSLTVFVFLFMLSVYKKNEKLLLLSFFVLCVSMYFKMFFVHCEECDITYDSCQYNHCCYCKKNYIHFFTDCESYFENYSHCCKCKNIYEAETEHICKVKVD